MVPNNLHLNLTLEHEWEIPIQSNGTSSIQITYTTSMHIKEHDLSYFIKNVIIGITLWQHIPPSGNPH